MQQTVGKYNMNILLTQTFLEKKNLSEVNTFRILKTHKRTNCKTKERRKQKDPAGSNVTSFCNTYFLKVFDRILHFSGWTILNKHVKFCCPPVFFKALL